MEGDLRPNEKEWRENAGKVRKRAGKADRIP